MIFHTSHLPLSEALHHETVSVLSWIQIGTPSITRLHGCWSGQAIVGPNFMCGLQTLPFELHISSANLRSLCRPYGWWASDSNFANRWHIFNFSWFFTKSLVLFKAAEHHSFSLRATSNHTWLISFDQPVTGAEHNSLKLYSPQTKYQGLKPCAPKWIFETLAKHAFGPSRVSFWPDELNLGFECCGMQGAQLSK